MTLYHYCSTEAFRSIISNRTIWLSSLISSNDALEGKWMTHVIGKVAADEKLSTIPYEQLVNMAEGIETIIDCLGLCMSVDGDTLSQWRGYADDGRGVSIGFNREFLQTLAGKYPLSALQQITYDTTSQKQRVRELFPRIKKLIDLGGLEEPARGLMINNPDFQNKYGTYRINRKKIFDILLELQPIWFSFKNPAFREEQEWRLTISVLPNQTTDYRSANGRLIPYQQLDFQDYQGPIVDTVRLGPKHPTPPAIVGNFLKTHGYHNVGLFPSEASYR